MKKEISFELPGVGNVTMVGIGPWKAVKSGGTLEVRDANNVVANPTVVQAWSTTTKPNTNVVFARGSTVLEIVATANAAFGDA